MEPNHTTTKEGQNVGGCGHLKGADILTGRAGTTSRAVPSKVTFVETLVKYSKVMQNLPKIRAILEVKKSAILFHPSPPH